MGRDKELEELRRQLAEGQKKVIREETKVGIESEKSKIRKQLFLLRHPKKIALARRFGRGLRVTGKKVGTVLIKQGKLIQAQQERDRRLDVARERMVKRKVKVRKSKRKSSSKGFDPFELNF